MKENKKTYYIPECSMSSDFTIKKEKRDPSYGKKHTVKKRTIVPALLSVAIGVSSLTSCIATAGIPYLPGNDYTKEIVVSRTNQKLKQELSLDMTTDVQLDLSTDLCFTADGYNASSKIAYEWHPYGYQNLDPEDAWLSPDEKLLITNHKFQDTVIYVITATTYYYDYETLDDQIASFINYIKEN